MRIDSMDSYKRESTSLPNSILYVTQQISVEDFLGVPSYRLETYMAKELLFDKVFGRPREVYAINPKNKIPKFTYDIDCPVPVIEGIAIPFSNCIFMEGRLIINNISCGIFDYLAQDLRNQVLFVDEISIAKRVSIRPVNLNYRFHPTKLENAPHQLEIYQTDLHPEVKVHALNTNIKKFSYNIGDRVLVAKKVVTGLSSDYYQCWRNIIVNEYLRKYLNTK